MLRITYKPAYVFSTILGLASIGIFLPLITDVYTVSQVIFFFLIYTTLAESYDIMGGFMGYVNLGHIVFYGIGAYVWAVAFLRYQLSPIAAFPLAAVIPAGFAFLFSYPIFRLKGFYFAVATLAFVELGQLIVASTLAAPITGGTDGMNFVQTNKVLPYYGALSLAVATVLLAVWLSKSKFGTSLTAIREDEEVADACGVRVFRAKQLALVTSGLIAGVAGALVVWNSGAIQPATSFSLSLAFVPVTFALLGGTGTIVGPIVGSAIYILLIFYLLPQAFGFQNSIIGILLILVGIFMPRGIFGSPFVRKELIRIYQRMKR